MNKIKEYRKKIGLTQKELADITGISLMSIRRYEGGERIPDVYVMRKIADALNVNTLDELILGSSTILNDIAQHPENWHESTPQEISDMAQTEKDRLNAAFDQLNDPGQEKVITYAEDLTKVPEYQRTPGQEED